MNSRALRGAAAAAASAVLIAKAGLVALDVAAMGAKGDGVTDDSAAIQQALDLTKNSTSSYVLISKPGTYIISWLQQQTVDTLSGTDRTALKHYANQTVVLADGVHMKLADGSSCSMIRNASGKDGDDNCVLVGGTWDGNYLEQTQNAAGTHPRWKGHGLVYLNCTRPVISPARCIDHYKYAIYLFYCLDATIGDVTFDTASDGVHLEAMRGTTLVGTIRGTCDDQALAWGARPGVDYYEEECTIPSPITLGHLHCDGIYATGGLSPFRAFGALNDVAPSFYIGPSGGTVTTGDFMQLSDDGPSLTGMTIKSGRFESIDGVVENGFALVRLGNCRTKDISIGRLRTTAAQNSAIVVESTVEVTLQAGYSGLPTKGATVTQQTSGATGKVKGIIGSTLYLTWLAGTWTTSGSLTVTQGSPSWTATGTAAVITGARSATIEELDCEGNTQPAVNLLGPTDTFIVDKTRVIAGSGGRLVNAGTYGYCNSMQFRAGLFEGNEIAFYFGNGAGRTNLKHGLHLRATAAGSLNPHYCASSGKASITVDGPIYQINSGTVNQAIGSGTELDYGGGGDRVLSTAGVPVGKGSYPTYAFISGGKIRINNVDAYTEVTNSARINDAKTGDLCTHNGAGGTLTDAGRVARYNGSAWTYS